MMIVHRSHVVMYNYHYCICKSIGAETTAKLTKMKVLIYGLRGIGVETCKNLALQGVGAITVSIMMMMFDIGDDDDDDDMTCYNEIRQSMYDFVLIIHRLSYHIIYHIII
jgi:hypothetical protein